MGLDIKSDAFRTDSRRKGNGERGRTHKKGYVCDYMSGKLYSQLLFEGKYAISEVGSITAQAVYVIHSNQDVAYAFSKTTIRKIALNSNGNIKRYTCWPKPPCLNNSQKIPTTTTIETREWRKWTNSLAYWLRRCRIQFFRPSRPIKSLNIHHPQRNLKHHVRWSVCDPFVKKTTTTVKGID